MKNLILILLAIIFFTNCSSGDNKSSVLENIFGEWKLTSFVNEQDGTSINADDPNYYDPVDNTEVSIIINFEENFDFNGFTSRNSFTGSFILNNSETEIIVRFGGTEVNETDFGNLFFDSLQSNYNPETQKIEITFKLNGDVLKLYYSDNEYMRLERI